MYVVKLTYYSVEQSCRPVRQNGDNAVFAIRARHGQQTRLTDSQKRRGPLPIGAGGLRRRPGLISRRLFAARAYRPHLNVSNEFADEHHTRFCSIDNRTHQNALLSRPCRIPFSYFLADSTTGSIWFSLKSTALLAPFCVICSSLRNSRHFQSPQFKLFS